MKINEFESGNTIEATLLVKSVNQGVTNKGSAYLSLVFQDSSGLIDAKLWDTSEALIQEMKPGNIYDVKANVINYKNVNQLKIESLKLNETYDITNLLRSSSFSKEELQAEIKSYIELIKHPHVHKIVVELLKEYHESYFEFPAAMSNHHNYVRGLSEHVVTMLRSAKALASIYTFLNTDLLYAGIILHDLGKLIELSGPIATTYTLEGNLLGHISIVVGKMEKIIDKFNLDSEVVLLLKHVVLAHHGKLEFGSPVLPQIPEAEIIHYIDNIDARMNAIRQAFEPLDAGNFTPRIFALENRSFYKAKQD